MYIKLWLLETQFTWIIFTTCIQLILIRQKKCIISMYIHKYWFYFDSIGIKICNFFQLFHLSFGDANTTLSMVIYTSSPYLCQCIIGINWISIWWKYFWYFLMFLSNLDKFSIIWNITTILIRSTTNCKNNYFISLFLQKWEISTINVQGYINHYKFIYYKLCYDHNIAMMEITSLFHQ